MNSTSLHSCSKIKLNGSLRGAATLKTEQTEEAEGIGASFHKKAGAEFNQPVLWLKFLA